jgi:Na+/H+ antiporter NhaD/arsenite permease-like protein
MNAELLWTLPFVALLISIAVLPLVHKHWWEKNYPYLAIGLGLIASLCYLAIKHHPEVLLHTAHEYLSFIALIGALYIVAGGIHIGVKGEAKPRVNCIFLFIGAVLANFLGTTGASMVLIRPWIRMNKYRITSFHIVFFIFVVSNVGGSLTPIGDPPLFLGYLRGVPFFWILQSVWMEWAVCLAILLGIFYAMDHQNYLRAPKVVRESETAHEKWRIEGKRNLFFLWMILGSVFIHDPPFLREAIMTLAAFLSWRFTPKLVHEKNDFNFAPITEVAILFLGIFATMIPALEWLEHHAGDLGIRTPGQFYWSTGLLSSVLDNAPTYLNFLTAASGLLAPGEHSPAGQVAFLIGQHPQYLRAISLGAVFFGAMTYIGNGPNFLVKSIADQSKVRMPSFFGYMLKYSVPILLPVLTLVWWVFFRTGSAF